MSPGMHLGNLHLNEQAPGPDADMGLPEDQADVRRRNLRRWLVDLRLVSGGWSWPLRPLAWLFVSELVVVLVVSVVRAAVVLRPLYSVAERLVAAAVLAGLALAAEPEAAAVLALAAAMRAGIQISSDET